ncbi:DUF3231 family protein [Ammoniphilus resinae]|uniref:DUF3231 family protein n=1 Tax=Ammoniphilus resinae TaxID=861532 RepID=A0ABS4GSZ0_9BACL|nr:DUF3231 family protein [Ammoniphilus resinae]MBP1933142.1 hypothetical protein [Ammoniphilus resinae]
MGILSGNPQDEPMHYGEVSGVWGYLLTTKALNAGYQVFLNHTGDADLKGFIKDVLRSSKQEIEQLENLLKANGVALPPTPPDRPEASIENIPPGARINDMEVAGAISRDIALGLVSCSSVIGQCIREDIATMFVQFHASKVQFGARLLRMNKEKGWLIPPPLHMQTPELVHA